MNKKLSDKERVHYIRKGNELFNNCKFKEAESIFMLTNYKDGILRIANRYFYELKQPLMALKFYYKIGAKEKIAEIRERMIFALKKLVSEEDKKSTVNIDSKKKQILNSSHILSKKEQAASLSLDDSISDDTADIVYPDEIS